jgi:Rrf2 family transcriptional regulator, nitric oxide-sensitive transcriptional repressor
VRLTQRTDIALRALIYLAAERESLCRVQDIADVLQVSAHHLQKTMGALAKAGFVDTRRGKGGGHRLARPPNEIRVGDVARALEPPEPVECFRSDNRCTLTPVCGLIPVISRAMEAFMATLDEVLLSDILTIPMRKRLVQLALAAGED